MTTPKRNHRALWKNVRIASDPRLISQLEYLQTTSAIALGIRPPSLSHLVRRAVGLLVEHYADMTLASRRDGLRELNPVELAAELEAMNIYQRVLDAPKARSPVDSQGRLCPWQEALHVPLGLAIPVVKKEQE